MAMSLNSKAETIREIVAKAFFLTMPAALFLPVKFYNILLVSFLALTLFFFIAKATEPVEKKYLAPLGLLLFILIYGLLHDFFCGYVREGLSVFETFLPLLFFPFLMWYMRPTPRRMELAKVSFFISAIFAAVICLLAAVYKNIVDPQRLAENWNYTDTQKFYEENPIDPVNWGYFLYSEYAAGIGFHPIYLGIFFLVAVVIGLSIITKPKSNWQKTFVILGIAMLIFQLMMLNGKMPILILGFIIIIGIFRSFRTRVRLRMWLIMITGGICILTAVVFLPTIIYRFKKSFETIMVQASSKSQTPDVASRMYLWRASWDVSMQKPLTGHGLFGARQALEKAHAMENVTYFNSHNQYLMILMVAGFCGLCLFLSGLWMQIRYAYIAKNYLYLAIFLIFCAAMLTENLLSRQKGIVLYTFFSSLFLFSFPISRMKD